MVAQAFLLINSFLSAVFLAYAVEALSLGDLFGLPSSLRLVLLGLALPLRVVVFSGLLGLLADMAAGRRDLVSKEGFWDNVRRHWFAYAGVSFGIVVLHFLLVQLFAARAPILPVFQACVDGVFLFWFARRALGNGMLAQRPGWSLYNILFLAVTYAAYLLACRSSFQGSTLGSGLAFGLFLVVKYLQLVLYALFLFLCLRAPSGDGAEQDGRELILVQPDCGGFLLRLSVLFVTPYPSFFLVLKALTPPSYRVREFNRRRWSSRYLRKDALVAVTCLTPSSDEAYRIARGFKEAGAKVVMGGPHVSFLPEEALEFCDSVVVGPAEGVWDEVVRDYENGTLKRVYQGSCPVAKFDQVDRYLLTCPPGQIKDFLETTRGCKFSCEFCIAPAWGKGLVRRDPKVVAALLKRVRTISREVTFIDYNLYADPAHMEAILNEIAPLGVKWYASMSIDVAQNAKMLRLMKQSGCRGILVGYEIYGDSDTAKQGGKFAMAAKYIELSKKIRRAGLLIKAHFIIGFDEDSWRGLWRLWRFAFRLSPDIIGTSFLQPLPGSVLFRRHTELGRITDLNWRNYNLFSIVFNHPRMSGALLERVLPLYFMMLYFTCSRQGILIVVVLGVLAIVAWQFGLFGMLMAMARSG